MERVLLIRLPYPDLTHAEIASSLQWIMPIILSKLEAVKTSPTSSGNQRHISYSRERHSNLQARREILPDRPKTNWNCQSARGVCGCLAWIESNGILQLNLVAQNSIRCRKLFPTHSYKVAQH
mmetsp:Transcript_90/g.383  ORF Transcript_90/g.383 Transcript_90/m.383 type:complete len:123 (-) Transcript_90:985-1353(-)